jgi:HK97 family phage portal protein
MKGGFAIFEFLKKFFKKEPTQLERAELLNGGTNFYTRYSGDAYASDIYRAAVDAIARNAAKLKGSHVINVKGQKNEGNKGLNRLLQVRPNPYMTAYDLIYKLVTHYYLHNNAFAYLQKDNNGYLLGIYPLRPQNIEFMSDQQDNLYCKFLFAGGKSYTLPYTDVLHVKRHFNDNDLLGDDNAAIMPALEVAHTQSEGMRAAIKSTATIRGILKYTQILAPEKLKQEKDAFIRDYLSVSNTGGVIVIDEKANYTPLEAQPLTIDERQLGAIKQKIYEYLGISEKIVNSTYNEDEWAAFYESTIEPLAVQLSLELTDKIFTIREQTYGNSIIFESNRLQFASTETKTNILKELMPLGLFTVNQALEILNLPAVEDGDKRLQTLNMVNAAKADQYQLSE